MVPKRQLGLFGSLMVAVGATVGIGVFLSPGVMASLVPSPGILLALLAGAALLNICQSLMLAELGGMFPQQGGPYVYLKQGLGRAPAALFAWVRFWGSQTGALAVLAVTFGRFAGAALGLSTTVATLLLPAGLVVVLTWLNVRGLHVGTGTQTTLNFAKLALLLVLVGGAFILVRPSHAWFAAEPGWTAASPVVVAAAAPALQLANSLFGGASQLAFMAGEVKRPERNLVHALWLAPVIAFAIYAATMLADFWVLPIEAAAEAGRAGGGGITSAVATAVLGAGGAAFTAAAIALAAAGTANAVLLAGPRLFYGAARQGDLWRPFGKLHGRFGTPAVALVFQAEWAIALILLSSLATDGYLLLLTSVSFANSVLLVLTTLAFFRLRRTAPQQARPFRTPLYPLAPLIVALGSILIVVYATYSTGYTLWTGGIARENIDRLGALWGAILFGIALLVLAWRRTRREEVVRD